MPPDEEKTTVEVSEETPEAEKKKPNFILFGGVGLVVVAIAVVATVFFMKGSSGGDSADTGGDAHATTEQADDHGEKPKKSGSHKAGDAIMYAINDIVVNPSGTGGSRFLSVSFGFELGSSQLGKEFEEREPLVRDALITILSSKSVAQLTDPKEKEIMRYQVKKRLEQLLKTDQLVGVYYTDFVLQ
ncbi:hypothetical protein GF420_02860 [candidate division GN15 bacterium]|nr:hypothetical protein [candidate division GN15 bacterium]